MPVPPTPQREVHDETDLEELPPLDGDGGEASSDDAESDDDLGTEKSPGGLDDATGEDEQPHPDDLEVDAGEGDWLDEEADASDLDIGEDLGIDLSRTEPGATPAAEGDDAGPPGEDLGVGEGLEAGGLDSGEEGPEGADEELRDQDLPDLGAAEEDEVDDASLEADRLSADEPMSLKWASRPWARVGAPVPFASASAVACAVRGALVAGRVESRRPELLRVDLEGGCQAVGAEGVHGAEIKALSVEGDVVAVIAEGGGAFLSLDGAERFRPLGDGVGAADVVVASGIVWVRTSSGELHSAPAAPGASLDRQRLAVGGSVAAIARDGSGHLAALVVDGERRPIALVHGTREGSLEREAVQCAEPCGPGLVAVRGARVAYAARRGVVRRGVDGIWREYAWDGNVVALAFVDADGGLVAATYSEADDTTGLVLVEGEGTAPRVMALLGPTQADMESDGRASALACDEARGVVWIAGGFGVASFSVR